MEKKRRKKSSKRNIKEKEDSIKGRGEERQEASEGTEQRSRNLPL